jgi:putative ABC transport system ATP-binding protein
MIELNDISKIYRRGSDRIYALKSVTVSIGKGEMVSVSGPSGSGKSTLMNIIGCIDTPTSGIYKLGGVKVSRLGRKKVVELRRDVIGFIFQDFNLISHFDARKNVELPLMFSNLSAKERRYRAENALEMVGLSERMKHYPSELSGGQMQRVAIARVIASDAQVIVADEPTGNLDVASAKTVIDILRKMNSVGKTVIIITHDPATADSMPRKIMIENGQIK